MYTYISIFYWFSFSTELWCTGQLSQVMNCFWCSKEKLVGSGGSKRENGKPGKKQFQLKSYSLPGSTLFQVGPGYRCQWLKHCLLRKHTGPSPQEWSRLKLWGQRRNWLVEIKSAPEKRNHPLSLQTSPLAHNQMPGVHLMLKKSVSCSVASYSLTTPWTIAHQAPSSMGFSRQEYWSGLPFPSPMLKNMWNK